MWNFSYNYYKTNIIILVQIVLLGLLLPLSVNGVESNCQYFQNVESGKIYYAYNNEYPYNYSGENNCIWQAASSSIIEVACSIKMVSLLYEYFVQNFCIDIPLIGLTSEV